MRHENNSQYVELGRSERWAELALIPSGEAAPNLENTYVPTETKIEPSEISLRFDPG